MSLLYWCLNLIDNTRVISSHVVSLTVSQWTWELWIGSLLPITLHMKNTLGTSCHKRGEVLTALVQKTVGAVHMWLELKWISWWSPGFWVKALWTIPKSPACCKLTIWSKPAWTKTVWTLTLQYSRNICCETNYYISNLLSVRLRYN